MSKEQSLFTAEEYKANFKKNKKSKQEEKIQIQVCEFLKNTYPDLIWFCDLSSGAKLPQWIAAINKKMRSSRGLPDLFIACPARVKSSYVSRHAIGPALFEKGEIEIWKHGLFIEIKKDGIRLKDGSIPPKWQTEKVNGFTVKYDHHAEQEAILKRLRELNYVAEFGVGYTEAVEIIKNYLGV